MWVRTKFDKKIIIDIRNFCIFSPDLALTTGSILSVTSGDQDFVKCTTIFTLSLKY